MKWGRWYSPSNHLLWKVPLFPSFLMVMWTSILAVHSERHLRWIQSDVLSIRRADKEWMAGRLPVKSLRVSTSSLPCFCHMLLFGLDLICPATPSTALCWTGSNLQHQSKDASRSSTLVQVHAAKDTGSECFFCVCVCVCELYQFKSRESARQPHSYSGVITSVASQQSPYTRAQLAKDSGFTIWSRIPFYKRHWRKEQLLLL